MMNDEQIAQEVTWIEDRNKWPMWPILPMKHLDRTYNDDNKHGILTFNRLNRVYLLSIFDFKKDVSIGDTLKDTPYEEFESVEAMVREGWVGD